MSEPKVRKRRMLSSTMEEVTKAFRNREGLIIGAIDAVYQRCANQAIIRQPSVGFRDGDLETCCWFYDVAWWFFSCYLTQSWGLVFFFFPRESDASLGGGWHRVVLFPVTLFAPSPLCNCKLQRTNSVFRLFHHQGGHTYVIEVFKFLFLCIPQHVP